MIKWKSLSNSHDSHYFECADGVSYLSLDFWTLEYWLWVPKVKIGSSYEAYDGLGDEYEVYIEFLGLTLLWSYRIGAKK